nr:uncharacterized protein LOC127331294 [Lolium perenne]
MADISIFPHYVFFLGLISLSCRPLQATGERNPSLPPPPPHPLCPPPRRLPRPPPAKPCAAKDGGGEDLCLSGLPHGRLGGKPPCRSRRSPSSALVPHVACRRPARRRPRRVCVVHAAPSLARQPRQRDPGRLRPSLHGCSSSGHGAASAAWDGRGFRQARRCLVRRRRSRAGLCWAGSCGLRWAPAGSDGPLRAPMGAPQLRFLLGGRQQGTLLGGAPLLPGPTMGLTIDDSVDTPGESFAPLVPMLAVPLGTVSPVEGFIGELGLLLSRVLAFSG